MVMNNRCVFICVLLILILVACRQKERNRLILKDGSVNGKKMNVCQIYQHKNNLILIYDLGKDGNCDFKLSIYDSTLTLRTERSISFSFIHNIDDDNNIHFLSRNKKWGDEFSVVGYSTIVDVDKEFSGYGRQFNKVLIDINLIENNIAELKLINVDGYADAQKFKSLLIDSSSLEGIIPTEYIIERVALHSLSFSRGYATSEFDLGIVSKQLKMGGKYYWDEMLVIDDSQLCDFFNQVLITSPAGQEDVQ